jgi:YD repeat-containing protein
LQGWQQATVKVDYMYPRSYAVPRDEQQTFNRAGMGVGVVERNTPIFTPYPQEWRVSLGAFDAQKTGLGGWTLDVHHSYDPLGRLKTVTLGTASVDGQPALNLATSYDYDINGRVIGVTDPRGKIGTTTYDAFGRAIATRDPLGNTSTFAYDALGRVILRTAGANLPGEALAVAYTYDPVGRVLTERVDPSGLNLLTQYRYARAGSDDTWNLQEVVDPRGALTRSSYNSLGLPATTTDALNQTWTFEYDNLGRLTEMVDPLGHRTAYTVDAIGLNTSLTQDGRSESWAYRADGSLERFTDFAGRATSYRYDTDGQVLGIDYPAGTADVSFAYDAAGGITLMTDGLGTTTYGYDALGRLLSRTRDGRTVGYTYDDGQLAGLDY